MNNKITLTAYDIANLKDALDMYKSQTEIIGSSVYRASDDFIKKNYHLQSVGKFLDFLKMVYSENRSQQGSVQTEIIAMTNEVQKQ